MEAPRDDLIRFVSFAETRATVDDGRTMVGYPIVFDTWTEINSWEGTFREKILPGAVARTLRNNRDQVKVLFNHGMDPQIGDKPLGKASVMKADDRGLYIEVPLSETSYNEDLIALMRDGAIDGMSFRFSVLDEEWTYPKNKPAERTIKELRLFEVGPVTFPAYQATSVGIRSREDFLEWRGLDETRRAAIAQIMGITDEHRTSTDGPAEGTPHVGLASTDDEGSAVGHPEASSNRNRQALDALALLRGLNLNATHTGRAA